MVILMAVTMMMMMMMMMIDDVNEDYELGGMTIVLLSSSLSD